MIIILDTNALSVSIPKKSQYRPILDALINAEFNLVLSNEILSEYVEILERKTNAIVANNIAEMLLSLDNLHKVEVYFEWKLIEKDTDDNKYVDDSHCWRRRLHCHQRCSFPKTKANTFSKG